MSEGKDPTAAVETELDRRLDAETKDLYLCALADAAGDERSWLHTSGMAVEASAWPAVTLGSPVLEVHLLVIGKRHGALPPAVALTMRVRDAPKVYGQDEWTALVHRDDLSEPLEVGDAVEARWAAQRLLQAARPIVEHDAGPVAAFSDAAAQLDDEVSDDVSLAIRDGRAAFDRGDFRRAKELLTPVEGRLTGGDRRRLEISRRRS